MILNNYWELLKVQQTNTFAQSGTGAASTNMKDTDGNSVAFAYQGSSSVPRNWNMSPDSSIILGSSDADGSVDDYDLTDPISSGVTASSPQWTFATSNGKYQRVVSFSVTASASVIIKEVGICKDVYTSYSGNQSKVMLARAVLSSPISLASGQSAAIVIEWNEG